MPMTRFITPEDFGARGDGTADDSIAFQAMIDEWSKGGKAVYGDGTYRIHNIQWKGLAAAPAMADPDGTGPLVTGVKERRLKPFSLENATLVNNTDLPMFLHPVDGNLTNTNIRIGAILCGQNSGPIWKGSDTTTIKNDSNGAPIDPIEYVQIPGVVSHCDLHFGFINFENGTKSAFDLDFGEFGRPKHDSDDDYPFSGRGTSFIDCRFTGNEWRSAAYEGSGPQSFMRIRTRSGTTNDNVFSVKRARHRNKAFFFSIGCTGSSNNYQLRFDGINFQTQVRDGQTGTKGGGLIALYGARNFEISNCLVFDTDELNSHQIQLSKLPAPVDNGVTRAEPKGCAYGVIRHFRRSEGAVTRISNESGKPILKDINGVAIEFAAASDPIFEEGEYILYNSSGSPVQPQFDQFGLPILKDEDGNDLLFNNANPNPSDAYTVLTVDRYFDIDTKNTTDVVIEHSDAGISGMQVREQQPTTKRFTYINTPRLRRFADANTPIGDDSINSIRVEVIDATSGNFDIINTIRTKSNIVEAPTRIITNRIAISPAVERLTTANGEIGVPGGYVRFLDSGEVTKITMPNVEDGERLTLTVAGTDAGDVIVDLKDDNDINGGNIRLKGGSTIKLDSNNDIVELMYEGTLAAWVPVSEAAQR